jgi:hypothetical protein
MGCRTLSTYVSHSEWMTSYPRFDLSKAVFLVPIRSAPIWIKFRFADYSGRTTSNFSESDFPARVVSGTFSEPCPR